MSFAQPYPTQRSFPGWLILGSLILLTLNSNAAYAQVRLLQAGSSFSSEIKPKESQLAEFDLGGGELIRITVNASGTALSMRVLDEAEATVLEVPQRQLEPLTWFFIASKKGRYRLDVKSIYADGPPGQYELRVDEIRPSTISDQKQAAAFESFYRAEVLRLEWYTSSFENAVREYEQAAGAFKQLRDSESLAKTWQQVGEVRFIQGNYEEARRAFSLALNAARKTNNVPLTVTQLNQLAYIHLTIGNVEKAEPLLAEVRTRLNKAKGLSTTATTSIQAHLENNYGEIALARGNLKESLALFARALALWKELNHTPGMALAHLNNGFAQLDSGNGNEASREFDESLKLWKNAADQRGVALTLTAKGNLFTLFGETYSALAAHREARDILRRIGDRQGEAVTLNGLGKVFEDLNRKEEAIDHYSWALSLNHELGNRDFEAVSSYYLGKVWHDLANWKLSLEYYERSLKLSLEAGKTRMTALARMDIAAVYVKQGRHAEALKLYQETLKLYREIEDLRRQATVHQGLGELFRTQGRLDQAAGEYELSRELFHRMREPQGEAESLYWLATIAQQQNDLPKALKESQRSVDLIEAQRNRVIGENWRSSYFAAVRRHFELHVDILMQVHKHSPTYGFDRLGLEASERARARSLLELLVETQGEIRHGVDQSLLDRERQLRQQLSVKANYQTKLFETGIPEDQLTALETEIRTLNSDYDFVQAQIKAQDPRYAELIQPSILNTQQIQAALAQDGGTGVLEYMLGEKRSHVWLITADSVSYKELPGREVLKELSTKVYRGLTARQQLPREENDRYQQRAKGDEELFCPNAMQLSRIILEPLLNSTKLRRLLVVPDGSLQYIPFEALPVPQANGCRLDSETADYVPLLTEFDVVHLHSFSALATLRQPRRAPVRPTREIAVWADPVFERDDPRINVPMIASGLTPPDPPWGAFAEPSNPEPAPPPPRLMASVEEAQSIMRMAPSGMSLILTGFEASRDRALSENLNDYRILHFATHSLVNNRYPALSGLWLSTFDQTGVRRNGLLQLHDIYGLRLNSDLVVLSGCQTGLGEEISGEGLIGLTQGFLHAGSKSVVVSLWNVQDKTTAVLMTSFYQAMLKEGLSPSMALRQAKLKMYSQRQWRSPYYWSAFVIQGEFRPSESSWSSVFNTRNVMTILAILGLAFWLVSTRFRRRSQTVAGGETIAGGQSIE